MKKLAERGIDLRNIKGSASADIKLEIPLDPEKENIFDISAKTEKIKLEAFGGKLSLKEARVKGLFDGKKVSVGIDGKINGFSSIINYEYNFSEKAEQEHYLKASTKIKGDGTNFGFVRLDSGKAALDFEYKKNRAGQENFTAISDLKGLEFYLVKIGIRKIIGQKANLSVSGILDEKGNGKTDLLLTGDDKLQIKSSIKIEGDSVLYSLPRITFENTDLKAEITENKDDFKIKISGPSWDLSSSEMKDFISKGSEDKAMELSLDAGKIFLKNGVYLNDVRFSLKCAKNRCEKGYLDAKLGSKLLKLILTPREGYEQWVISTGNAGALLRALGIYQNMKAGTLMAVLETRREETPVGAIVPVTDGKFSIKKFTLSNAPFLTRIVSFVSMPGFVSFLTNNKNVNFLQMEGAFSYSSDRVKIIKSSAEGPFFDFTMRGDIDTEKRLVKLKGDVVPSLYGISSLIRSVPVLGKLFGGKKKPYKGSLFLGAKILTVTPVISDLYTNSQNKLKN